MQNINISKKLNRKLKQRKLKKKQANQESNLAENPQFEKAFVNMIEEKWKINFFF